MTGTFSIAIPAGCPTSSPARGADLVDRAVASVPWAYCRRFQLGAHRVVVCLRRPGVHRIAGPEPTTVVGFIARCSSDVPVTEAELRRAGGQFVAITERRDGSVAVYTDSVAGARCYVLRFPGGTFVTDDLPTILTYCRELLGAVDAEQVNYWKRARYTFAERTFFENLKKIPPSCTALIHESRADFLFEVTNDCCEDPDRGSSFHDRLSAALATLRDLPAEPILMFSGGADSTLLALLLTEAGIRFVPVFFHSSTVDPRGGTVAKAAAAAARLGQELTVLHVRTESAISLLRERVFEFLFDRHFALLHLGGFEALARAFGPRAIVNGQTSDSVLSFGPSTFSPQDYVRRLLTTPGARWLASPIAPLVARMFQLGGARFPRSRAAAASAMATFDRYCLLETGDCRRLADSEVVQAAAASDLSFAGMLLWIKRLSFIAGSDNQVVHRSAGTFGFDQVLLPFATPGIISWAARRRSSLLDLVYPKYAVRQLQRRLLIDSADSHTRAARPTCVTPVPDVPLVSAAQEVSAMYLSALDGLGIDAGIRPGTALPL
jgi:hypothetical protein